MRLLGTVGAPVFGVVDVNKFVEAYESLSSHTGTDLAAEDVIAIFPYYCSQTTQETIKVMTGYVGMDWVQLKVERKDTVVKWRSYRTESPSSILCRTSYGIPKGTR